MFQPLRPHHQTRRLGRHESRTRGARRPLGAWPRSTTRGVRRIVGPTNIPIQATYRKHHRRWCSSWGSSRCAFPRHLFSCTTSPRPSVQVARIHSVSFSSNLHLFGSIEWSGSSSSMMGGRGTIKSLFLKATSLSSCPKTSSVEADWSWSPRNFRRDR